jgi:hypothetical protein
MQKRYPFKFLDAYTREDSAFFFGRTDEIDRLYEMVFQCDLILVYGASGTGKTSLIQCGLASKFQSHDWLALNIRRGSNLNVSFEKALQDAGADPSVTNEGATQSHPVTNPNSTEDLDWLDDDLMNESTVKAPEKKFTPLARRFKSIYLKHFKPLYLIFDQFEELYILGSKSEQKQFVATVKEILQVEQPVKIILSIREEYLGYLYEFEREVPELLRKKLRVEPMNLDKVETVIKSIGRLPQSNVRLESGQEDAIAEGIFEKIRGEEKTLSIQLPYLQVFLDKLYLQITQDESRQANAIFTPAALANMGNIGDVLRNFLDEQVLQTAQNLGQKPEIIWHILSPFVTLEGTKEPLSAQILDNRLPTVDILLIEQVLQAFVNSRILRYTEKEELYEIAHDSLAKQIHAKRSDEEIAILEVQRLIKSQVALKTEVRDFFSEKQLLFIEPYLSKFAASTEEMEWIEKSRGAVQSNKAAEAKRQAEELENAQSRAVEAERLTLAAHKGRKRARALAYLGIFAFFKQKEANNANEFAQKETTKAQAERNNALRSDSLAQVATKDALEKAQAAHRSDSLAQIDKRNAIAALQKAKTAATARLLAEQSQQKTEILRLLNDADTYIRAKLYKNARAKLQTVLKLDPENREAKQKMKELQ